MKEYNVGEIFEYGNNYLQVVEKNKLQIMNGCCDCCFHNYFIDCNNNYCLPDERKDNKSVIYKLLTKNEIRKLKFDKINSYDRI